MRILCVLVLAITLPVQALASVLLPCWHASDHSASAASPCCPHGVDAAVSSDQNAQQDCDQCDDCGCAQGWHKVAAMQQHTPLARQTQASYFNTQWMVFSPQGRLSPPYRPPISG